MGEDEITSLETRMAHLLEERFVRRGKTQAAIQAV